MNNINYKTAILGLNKKVLCFLEQKRAKKFIIFFHGRSGSSLLISLLNNHPLIKAEGEILSRNVFFPGIYLDLRSYLFLDNYTAYGVKCKQSQIKQQTNVNNVEQTFLSLSKRGFKFIYLKRKNKLKQALSAIAAGKRAKKQKQKQKGNEVSFFRISQEEKDKLLYLNEKLTIEPKNLIRSTSFFERVGQEEDRIMNLVPHLEITYETDLLKPQSHQATINKICDFLGIETADCHNSNLVKANSDNIRDLVDNASELIEAIEKSKYAHYLDANN